MTNVISMIKPTNKDLIQEGMMLLDDAIGCFMNIDTDECEAMTNAIYGILRMAEKLFVGV